MSEGKKKILFVTHYSELYGANRSLLALLDGLDRTRFTPFVIIPRIGPFTDRLREKGIHFYIFPFRNWMSRSRTKALFRFIINIISIPFFLYIVKSLKIDLIYTNTSVTPVGIWTSYLSRIPHVWHFREFGWKDYRMRYDFGETFFNYWIKKSNRIIAVSNALKSEILEEVKDKTSVIYNGVISKKEAIEFKSKELNQRSTFIFGIIGLLQPGKGQEDAIKAFAEIKKEKKDVELWIAGKGGKYELHLKKLTRDLEIERWVNFVGYVDNPFDFFSTVHAILVCSRNEAMGRVTAEAMVLGKPVIGLDSAGTKELIRDGYDGLLYNGSVKSLTKKMEYLLNNDFEMISLNARKKGFNEFLIEDYVRKVTSVINLASL